ncbi:MAG: hypothetical protein HYS06_01310 [Methylocystis sp.]|nr:hypothetical protein [Methylocystis sp.]
MLMIGIVLGFIALGYFCWLLFALAVYALPFFAGVTAGLAAYHSGSGPIGAIAVGLIAGVVTLVVGQIAFAAVRSPVMRATIAPLFAAPAAVAGYHATLGLAHIGAPSQDRCEILAVIGAIVVGGTAWARMTVLAPPNVGRRVMAGSTPQPFASASRDG